MDKIEKLYRLVDSNINRAAEGLRVIEDIYRFFYSNYDISKSAKIIRHGIRGAMSQYNESCIIRRDSENDVGLTASKSLRLDERSGVADLVSANFKRVQEALRTIEESLKVLDNYELAKVYESYRFDCYALEKKAFIKGYAERNARELISGLYCITAEEHSRGRSNIEVVKAMINAGVKVIQYREKDKKLKDKYNECVQIREMTKNSGVTFIINDDIDIAILVKADGIHIGQDDLPIEKVRELVGDDMLIGLSTHSPEQARDAVKRKADYIGVGPIYKTYTKKDVCEPVGLGYLEYVVNNLDIPHVAIGGIKEANLGEVLEKCPGCIALVTEITGADDIEEKIKSIRRICVSAGMRM